MVHCLPANSLLLLRPLFNQFVIQLYAMAVQQESVTIVQMVSLPLSFLSLTWASTVADEVLHSDGHFRVKDKVLVFSTHLFILSIRLFAVALFTVSYKWWVTSVLILHCTVITISDIGRGRNEWEPSCGKSLSRSFFRWFHWLRDDFPMQANDVEKKQNKKEYLRTMQLVSNVLFVIENIIMILLFYFSHFPHTWYSLPVTIYVCLFAVLGAVIRLTHFYFLTKESDGQSNNTDQVQLDSYSNPVEVAAT